jgi:hypothetical protein
MTRACYRIARSLRLGDRDRAGGGGPHGFFYSQKGRARVIAPQESCTYDAAAAAPAADFFTRKNDARVLSHRNTAVPMMRRRPRRPRFFLEGCF